MAALPKEVVRLFADCLGIYDFASQDPALEIQDFSRTFDFDTRLRHGGMLGMDFKVSWFLSLRFTFQEDCLL